MQGKNVDKDVFIRSLASRGWKGGLAKAATDTIHVMDAMGKDVIFVEAVGSGQGEVDIVRIADTCVIVLNPGMGDEIQMMKAIGGQCAMAIRNAQMYAALKSRYDTVTDDFQRWFEHYCVYPSQTSEPTPSTSDL